MSLGNTKLAPLLTCHMFLASHATSLPLLPAIPLPSLQALRLGIHVCKEERESCGVNLLGSELCF